MSRARSLPGGPERTGHRRGESRRACRRTGAHRPVRSRGEHRRAGTRAPQARGGGGVRQQALHGGAGGPGKRRENGAGGSVGRSDRRTPRFGENEHPDPDGSPPNTVGAGSHRQAPDSQTPGRPGQGQRPQRQEENGPFHGAAVGRRKAGLVRESGGQDPEGHGPTAAETAAGRPAGLERTVPSPPQQEAGTPPHTEGAEPTPGGPTRRADVSRRRE